MFFTLSFYHKRETEATVFSHLGLLFFRGYFATAPAGESGAVGRTFDEPIGSASYMP